MPDDAAPHLSDLAPYPGPEARERELVDITEAVGGERVEYGRSVEDRPLVAVRVPALGDVERRVMVCANIHGIEWIGNRIAHRFLASLEGEEGRRLRERAEVWVAPCLNPDGYARTAHANGAGRARDLRKNARKVDLNRNFPLPFGAEPSRWPTSGSYVEDDPTYRGEAPLSEPETRHLCALLDELRPWASANLHSFMGTMIPARTPDRSDADGYRRLHRALRSAQRHAPYRLMQLPGLDVFTGEQEDHQHHVHQTWAACIEAFPVVESFRQHLRAPKAFWRFNPRDPERWIANDVPGLYAFFHAALDEERPPAREGAATPRATWKAAASG